MANLSNINNKFIVASDGKVGIGTTVLNTISGTNPTLTLGGTGISGGLILQKAGTDTARLYENAGNMVHQGMTGVGHNFYVNAATQAMIIDSSGNVGIGATSIYPQGNDTILKLYSTSVPRFYLQNTTTGSNVTDGSQIYVSGSDLYITNSENANTIFSTNSLPRMRIDSSGNVGVGGSPVLKLEVQGTASSPTPFGSAAVNGVVRIASGGTNPMLDIGSNSAAPYEMWLQAHVPSNTYGTPISLQPLGGNVGIGTTSPGTALAFGGFGSIWVNNDSTNPFGMDTVGGELRLFVGTGSNSYQMKFGKYSGTTFTPHMTIGDDSSNPNYVGIGTTSPQQLLHINEAGNTANPGIQVQGGSFGFTLNKSPQTADYVHLKPLGSGPSVLRVLPNTSSSASYIEAWGTDYEADSVNWNRIYMNVTGSSGNATITTSSSGTGAVGNLYLGTHSNQQTLTILNSGNVGIGRTAPDYKLVVSNNNAEGIEFGPGYVSGSNLWQNYNRTIGTYVKETHYGSEYHFMPGGGTTGNVGINTVAPRNKLTVKTAGSAVSETALRLVNPVGFTSAGSGARIVFAQDRSDSENFEMAAIDGIQGIGGSSSNGELGFFTRGSSVLAERLRITAAGITKAFRGNAGDLFFADNTSSAGGGIINYNSSLAQQSNNTSCSHFKGTTQNIASYHLYGNGSSSWSSDSRLKRDIKTTRDGYIDDISKLRVVKYKWKNDENSGLELGLIAQEVEKIFPSLVVDHEDAVGNGETYKSLKYSVLPTILLKGMQEQQKMIQELKAEIELLKSK